MFKILIFEEVEEKKINFYNFIKKLNFNKNNLINRNIKIKLKKLYKTKK